MAGAFDGFLGAVFGSVSDRVMPVIDHSLRPWIANLSTEAIKSWTPLLVAGVRCNVPVSPTSQVRCGGPGVRACICCNVPVCLHHAMVAQTADVVCIKCVTDYMKLMREKGQEPAVANPPWVESGFEGGKARAKAPPPPQGPSVEDEQKVRERHLRALGLDEDADEDEVKAAYREMVKKYHPDKASSEVEKARFNKKFLKIQAAWEYLKP